MLRQPNVDDNGDHRGQLGGGSEDGEDHAGLRACADPRPVEQGQQEQGGNRGLDQHRLERPDDDADIDDAGERAERRRQEVVDQDQEAAKRARQWMERPRGDRDHAAALRIPGGDLRVLHGQQDEDDQRHGDEEGGMHADLAVEDPRRVVNRRADVGEDHAPAEERPQRATVEPSRQIAAGGRLGHRETSMLSAW